MAFATVQRVEPSPGINENSVEDDDDDLEALRRAALLSRKSSKQSSSSNICSDNTWKGNHHNYRNPRINSASRENNSKAKWRHPSNLIVINTVPLEDPSNQQSTSIPPLVLPQDKWAPNARQNVHSSNNKAAKGPNKFSRIRSNSDESDMDDSDDSLSDIGTYNRNIIHSYSPSRSPSPQVEESVLENAPNNDKSLLYDEGSSSRHSADEINEKSGSLECSEHSTSLNSIELPLDLKVIDSLDIDSDEETLEKKLLESDNELEPKLDVKLEETLLKNLNEPLIDNEKDEISSVEDGFSHKDGIEHSDDASRQLSSAGDDGECEESVNGDAVSNSDNSNSYQSSFNSEERIEETDRNSEASLELAEKREDDIDIELSNQGDDENVLKVPVAKRIVFKERGDSKNLTSAQKRNKSPPTSIRNSKRSKHSKTEESSTETKTDLRHLLKARRNAKQGHLSGGESSSRSQSPARPSQTVKSVLSVVKPLLKLETKARVDHKEVRKEERKKSPKPQRSISLGRNDSRAHKPDNVQVTLVTDIKSDIEKKCPVHMRLGPINKSINNRNRNASANEHQMLSKQTVKMQSGVNKRLNIHQRLSYDEQSSGQTSINNKHQQRSVHRVAIEEKVSRRKEWSKRGNAKRSGFSNVKEHQLDAKIRRMQDITAAILKRQEEVEADIERYGK